MRVVNLVNLTPHPVVVVSDREVRRLEPSGQVLRLAETVENVGELDGIPLVRKTLRLEGELPPRQDGVYYVVSLAVAQMAGRPDFLVPDDLVRDEEGRVIGCRRFAIINPS